MVSHLVNTIRNVVGITGNVISVFLFFVSAKGSVEQFSSAPYLAALISCMILVTYGLPMVHPNGTLVVTINGTGTAIEVVYLTLFLIFCHDKRKRSKVLLIVLAELIFIAVVTTLALTVVHTTERRSMVVGVITILFNIMMYAAPLSVMVPNGLGTLFGLAQLLVYATYYKSTKRIITRQETKIEMHLSEVVVNGGEDDPKKVGGAP